MKEQDPSRRDMQPPLPTHPPAPPESDADKVAGKPKPLNDNDTSLHSMGLPPGQPMDGAGGPGLGQASGEGNTAGKRADH